MALNYKFAIYGGDWLNEITLGSLFDGIGGFPYAASFYGIRSLWASEIIPECVSVTKRHIPEMVHVGDITYLDGHKLVPVDIITFGSLCQGLSIAGQRRGLADERSGLFMEAVRIIHEMREATHGEYPKFAVWENVPGALSSAGGRDFKIVLEAVTKAEIPMPGFGRWANAGIMDNQSPTLTCAHGQAPILARKYYVRRLTPLECERLQGFPDGWTEYGYNGRRICDTKRYQMLGNSVAVPCVAYIMQGICQVLEENEN